MARAPVRRKKPRPRGALAKRPVHHWMNSPRLSRRDTALSPVNSCWVNLGTAGLWCRIGVLRIPGHVSPPALWRANSGAPLKAAPWEGAAGAAAPCRLRRPVEGGEGLVESTVALGLFPDGLCKLGLDGGAFAAGEAAAPQLGPQFLDVVV